MEKKAVVLLALREDLTTVTWVWTPEGAEADDMLATGGIWDGVKAMSTSPTDLTRLDDLSVSPEALADLMGFLTFADPEAAAWMAPAA